MRNEEVEEDEHQMEQEEKRNVDQISNLILRQSQVVRAASKGQNKNNNNINDQVLNNDF